MFRRTGLLEMTPYGTSLPLVPFRLDGRIHLINADDWFQNTVSSVQAGTWEEKNLNSWANSRIKDLLGSLDPLEFSTGKASVYEVFRCSGDAFLVTVRNKKRVGYNYELSLKFKGEWLIKEENKKVKGHLEIPEFSFGELEDLEVNVRLSDDKDLPSDVKLQICKDMKSFLAPIQEKLREFEKELKER
ncbi:hypothetical protein PAHAL_4G022900 [Panicum hallii]|uniref:Activator of Hsp90 ATPase AHSA1-like N-terminal domain-containing protein n=1 Tax=Panicum hallii TaxID=206008 RepID=A0A2S3HGK9_9POAL|nr:hypothetical protein PAHAL_4G022900 [Panicum hallii]